MSYASSLEESPFSFVTYPRTIGTSRCSLAIHSGEPNSSWWKRKRSTPFGSMSASLRTPLTSGNEVQRASAAGLAENPDTLTVRLDWERAYKTDYELQCLDEASQLGVTGHKAAKEAFDEGASELEIHYTFLQTLGVTERDLPYPSIVALNEKGAFLHYGDEASYARRESSFD